MCRRLLSTLVVCNLIMVASAFGEEKVEKYPDGGKHWVYNVNSEGRKVGLVKEFYPNGKLKVQATYRLDKLHGTLKRYDAHGALKLQKSYRDGDLDGVQQEYDGGHLVAEQYWLNGVLLAPRSPGILAEELKAIQSATIQTVGKPPKVTPQVQQALENPRLQESREAALRVLMAYRCVCALPYRDMVLDWTYIAHDEAGSLLLTQIHQMTHTPANPGLPEDEYRFAFVGTSSSNLFSNPGLSASVHAFMDDSDAGNIDRLGHRRWCLNPAMGKTGFGGSGSYAVMWSFDGSRTSVPDYNYVAYPPRGFTPLGFFHENYAWSVSLNPAKFRAPSPERVKVAVYPVQFNFHDHILKKSPTPLPLNYAHINLVGFGISNCIIFRPTGFKVAAGETFAVYISGLSDTSGRDTKVEYLVAFTAL